MACVLHGLVVRNLLRGNGPAEAVSLAQNEFLARSEPRWADEMMAFHDVLHPGLADFPEREVASGGGDTDTTGCVAGGLAGTCFGMAAIPAGWTSVLARAGEIEDLFDGFATMISRV